MQIDIQARGFTLTDALREHVERQLQFAIHRLQEQVVRVSVRLSDINGPKGGKDQQCRIQIHVGGIPDVVIEDTEENLYVAITRATSRAGRTLRRNLRRARGVFDRRLAWSEDDPIGL